MTRFEFFSKILARIEEIQNSLNNLRATVKEEIQSVGGENQ